MQKIYRIKEDFYDIGQVWIKLTEREYNQMKAAHHAPWWIWLVCAATCRAELMSEELEEILCGHRPDRYEVIIPWSEHRFNEQRKRK